MNWIIDNSEWLFSGIAIAIPIAIFTRLTSSTSKKQKQKGGKNSTNIQVGGDLKIGENKNDG